MKKAFLAVIVGLGLLSCDNPGPEPVASTFLTVKIEEPYDTGFDSWIFATTESGELLDVKRLEDGVTLASTVEFSSFDLSILRVTYYKQKIFDLTTYRNFNQSEIVLGNLLAQLPRPKPIGQVRVTITGIPEDKIYSTPFSIGSGLYREVMEGNWTYTKTSYSVVILLARQPDKIIVTSERLGTPVYHIFNNVMDGTPLTVDFADMTPYQEVFTLSINGSGYIRLDGLRDEDQSTFPLLYTDGSLTKPLRMWTVPGFAKYRTTIYTMIGTTQILSTISYIRKGAVVSSYTPPQYSLDVTDPTMSNLTASFDLAYDYQYAVWTKTHETDFYPLTSVHVYSDNSSTPTVKYEIPQVILSEHPSLSFDKLRFGRTSYYRSMGTYSYSDFLVERFKGKVKGEYELYEFTAY